MEGLSSLTLGYRHPRPASLDSHSTCPSTRERALRRRTPPSPLLRTEGNDATALLERLVDINSGTMNLAGVREVGRILGAELDGVGFTTRWIDLPETKRAGHLFAERKGNRGKRLLLIGHLDTVFENDSPFQ